MLFKFDENKKIELASPEIVENAVCEDVLVEEMEDIIKLGEAMIEFCVQNGGVGLAAPQIGVMKKMFVWMNGQNTFQVVVNPDFFPDKKQTNTIEGCLTYGNKLYYMKRWKSGNAKFEFLDSKDKNKFKKTFKHLNGEQAIVFQHELDHLNGLTIAMKGELVDWKRN